MGFLLPRRVSQGKWARTLLGFVCRQLVLFIGPTGYHRSLAQTECVCIRQRKSVREKDRETGRWKRKRGVRHVELDGY